MQRSKLYVGNLSYNIKDEDLKNLFVKYGTVQTASIIMDRQTGQSKGFGFVEFASMEEAEKALELNGQEFAGRKLTVSEARPQEPRASRGGRMGSQGFQGPGQQDMQGREGAA